MATCLEYAKERTDDCEVWEDQGNTGCSSWSPWFSWICFVFVWISNMVCIAYVWVTTGLCVLWDIVVTIADAIIVTLESILVGWILNLVATFVELIFLIPFLGPALKWVWNVVLTVFNALYGIADAVAYLFGIRPQKKLRVCTIIYVDRKGNAVASDADVLSVLNRAIQIYFREMNVVIVRSAPFQYTTGFLTPPVADASWLSKRIVSDETLTACCNLCMAGEEFGGKGRERQWLLLQDCFWGNWRRLLGLGAPVVIFIIKSMESTTITFANGTKGISQTIGCALGPLTDYITVASSGPAINIPNALQASPDTTAHELGHKNNLWHLKLPGDTVNLMFANEDNLVDSNGIPLSGIDNQLYDWQRVIVRASRHLSYI